MKMKKMIFLMLTLLIWGVASMNAQVRIGGTIDPDPSVLLDVNKTDDAAPAGNLGLGLPRVALTSANQPLVTGKTPKPGTMIYNTSANLDGAGVYYWATTAWAKLSSGNADTATKLATARTIGMTGDVTYTSPAFDGSQNVTAAGTLAAVTQSSTTSTQAATAGGTVAVVDDVTRDTKGRVTGVNTKTVTLPATQTTVSGNAGTATKLATSRNIILNGNVTGTAAFDGSANATITTTIATDAVTTAKIASKAVTTDKIANKAVTPTQIEGGTDVGMYLRSTSTGGTVWEHGGPVWDDRVIEFTNVATTPADVTWQMVFRGTNTTDIAGGRYISLPIPNAKAGDLCVSDTRGIILWSNGDASVHAYNALMITNRVNIVRCWRPSIR
jgi:hypothetical protein